MSKTNICKVSLSTMPFSRSYIGIIGLGSALLGFSSFSTFSFVVESSTNPDL